MRIALIVLAAVAACAAYPYAPKQATSPGAFIGEGINGIAAALLQDSDEQSNAAFSPLGHSAILAALAEGAGGKTRAQMLAALKLPQDSSLTRATYRSVLSRMREKNAVGKPEFRSWFYVYAKSIQLEPTYTSVLKDHYLMVVRDIQALEEDTPEEFFIKKEDAPAAPAPATDAPAAPAPATDAPAAPAEVASPALPEEEMKKDPVMTEELPRPSEEEEKKDEEVKKEEMKVEGEMIKKEEMKEGEMKEEEKEDMKEEKKEEMKEEMKEEKKDEMRQEEEKVEDAMPASPAEAALPLQEDTAKVGEAAMNQEEQGEEAVDKPTLAEAAAQNNNKISLAKFAGKGEAKDEKKPTGDKKKEDIKKKGREAEASEDMNDRQPSSGPFLLTTFNALYYRGAWQVPFDAKFKDDFFVGDGRGETKEVTTLRTQGAFRIGDIKELNATAIELPYKGESGRYSLLVLLPRAQDGLPKLTKALSDYSFRFLAKSMREKQVDVAIPEFEVDHISHPQSVFKKLGMSSMFDKDTAEFPGISKKQRLHLQDDAMAQLVRFKVDDKSAVANYLSAMSMSTRSGLNVFHANHPFVFYLRDNLDNLTILVGRVTDPTQRPASSALDIQSEGPSVVVPEVPEAPESPDEPAAAEK